MSPDGTRLFSGAEECAIKQWALNSLPEERISAVFSNLKLFSDLPKNVGTHLSDLVLCIDKRLGQPLPCDRTESWCGSGKKKRLALDLYNARFFLPDVAEVFMELAERDVSLEEEEAIWQEALQRFNRFSDSLQAKTYEMLYQIQKEAGKLVPCSAYAELCFKEKSLATYEERAEALRRVYPALISSIGKSK
jgi:hypothetical protein